MFFEDDMDVPFTENPVRCDCSHLSMSNAPPVDEELAIVTGPTGTPKLVYVPAESTPDGPLGVPVDPNEELPSDDESGA